MAHGDINHNEIPVSDMDRAKEFYAALFGWDIQEFPGFEGYPMWRSADGTSGGALTPCSESFTHPRPTVEVDSIEEALRQVVERGGRVLQDRQPIDETSWWAVFEDPDGNTIGLWEGTTQP